MITRKYQVVKMKQISRLPYLSSVLTWGIFSFAIFKFILIFLLKGYLLILISGLLFSGYLFYHQFKFKSFLSLKKFIYTYPILICSTLGFNLLYDSMIKVRVNYSFQIDLLFVFALSIVVSIVFHTIMSLFFKNAGRNENIQ
jgi:hypothetical protein